MELSIILITLLKTIVPGNDLCADVYVDGNGQPYTDAIGQTWSRFCEWAGPDAPVLDMDVCCAIAGDTAACSLPDANGRCWSGSLTYCEYGTVLSTGGVVCQQPFPSICDFGHCGDVMPPDGGPFEDSLCCWSGVCWEIETVEHIKECGSLGGYSGYCINGVQNEDGTVDCFD